MSVSYDKSSEIAAVRTRRSKKHFIDPFMSVAAVVHPLTALPQVYSIYATRSDVGVSLWTWLGFMAIGTVFLSYGIVHRIKPFIVTQILWFLVDLLVVIGILLYS